MSNERSNWGNLRDQFEEAVGILECAIEDLPEFEEDIDGTEGEKEVFLAEVVRGVQKILEVAHTLAKPLN